MVRTLTSAIRTFVLVPLFFLLTVVFAAVIVTWRLIRPDAPLFDRLLRLWSSLFLRIPPVRYEVTGAELVDPSMRYIVVANHLSMFDIPLLMASLPINGRFLAKHEVFKIPIIGQAMRAMGIVEVKRGDGASIRQAVREGVTLAAERGYSLLIFPEGTRGDAHEMLKFKTGAFRIAIDTGLPILPVVITGTDQVSKPGSKLFFPGHCTVHILTPIETTSLTTKSNLKTLTTSVRTDMVNTYKTHVPPSGGTSESSS